MKGSLQDGEVSELRKNYYIRSEPQLFNEINETQIPSESAKSKRDGKWSFGPKNTLYKVHQKTCSCLKSTQAALPRP
jgi:hypothetical protein